MSRMPRPWGPLWPPALTLGATHPLLGAVVGLALVAVLVALLYVFHGEDPRQTIYPSIPLFFLVPVLLASAIGGQRAGVLVSCAAVFTWDWFFILPLYMVTIASARDVLALVVFLAVALLVGQLATATRRRAEEALRRAQLGGPLRAAPGADRTAGPRRGTAGTHPASARHVRPGGLRCRAP